MATDPLTCTIPEAAALLGISSHAAYDLAKRDEFPVPVLTIGRSRRVARGQLAAYIGDVAEAAPPAGPPPIDDATMLAAFRQLGPEDQARVAGFIAGLVEARR